MTNHEYDTTEEDPLIDPTPSSDYKPRALEKERLPYGTFECTSTGNTNTEAITVDDEGDARKARVTVEPVVFLYSTVVAISTNLTQLLLYDIIALEHNTSSAILRNSSSCGVTPVNQSADAALSARVVRDAVQQEAANWSAVLGACQLPIALLATVLMGGYSDAGGGRRPVLVGAVSGSLLRMLATVPLVLAPIAGVYQKAGLVLAFVLEAFGGGMAALLAAVYAYLSDVTTHAQRALRIVLLEAALGFGYTVGYAASGYLIAALGYGYSFVLLGGVLLTVLLYVWLVLPESRKPPVAVKEKARFLSVKHVVKVWRMYSRQDDAGAGRWRLWACLLILMCHCVAELGRYDAFNYYVLNAPFCWDPVMIGYYGAVAFPLFSLGSILATKLLERSLGDLGLLVLGAIFAFSNNMITCFATTTVGIYIAAFVGAFGLLPLQMVRSYNSKLVSAQDQGTVYAALAWVQVTASLGGKALLSSVYMLTVSQLAGATFIVAAAFDLISCCTTTFLLIKDRKRKALIYKIVTDAKGQD